MTNHGLFLISSQVSATDETGAHLDAHPIFVSILQAIQRLPMSAADREQLERDKRDALDFADDYYDAREDVPRVRAL